MVKIKRVYDPESPDDGFRVLVDRLWPRGISKKEAYIGLWLKEVAPSTGLRKWFNHDPAKWEDFVKRYKNELLAKADLISTLKQMNTKYANLTLLYGAKDTEHNEAVVLVDLLMRESPMKL